MATFATAAGTVRYATAMILSILAVACVLVMCGLALILTLALAPPLKRLRPL